jgi:hypothetical protein
MTLLKKFGWKNFDHSLDSTDLTPSDFHIFAKMKEFLGSKWMATDEEVKETVMDWSNGLVTDFYDERIIKLVQHLGKCLNHNWDYVEKLTYRIFR